MKLVDYLLLSAAVGFFLIGVDQMIRATNQPDLSYYWIFMLSAACLLGLYWRRHQRNAASSEAERDTASHQHRKHPSKKHKKK